MINNKVSNSTTKLVGRGQDLEISLENKSKIFEANIDIYSNKFRFITEIVSNAHDATVERAIALGEDIQDYIHNNPIIISLTQTDENADYLLSIKETSGVGISPDRIKDIFLYLNKSTKESSEDFIGAKGKGRLSTLAYADHVIYQTVYNNRLYNYTLYRYKEVLDKYGQKKQIVHPQLVSNFNMDVTPTLDHKGNETNYTEVIIPIKRGHKYDFYDELKDQLRFFSNIVYSLPDKNREDALNNNQIYEFNHFRVSDISPKKGTVYVLLDKVPYKVDIYNLSVDSEISRKFNLLFNYNPNIALPLTSSDLLPNESREQLIYGDVYKYYNKKSGEEVKFSEAIEKEKNGLKEEYERKVVSTSDIIVEKLTKALDEIHSLIEKEKEPTNNFFKLYSRENVREINIPNLDKSIPIVGYSYRNSNFSLLKYPALNEELYAEKRRVFNIYFIVEGNKLAIEDLLFTLGRKSASKTASLKYDIDCYNEVRYASYDSDVSSGLLREEDKKIVLQLLEDAKEVGGIIYQDLPKTKVSRTKSYRTERTGITYKQKFRVCEFSYDFLSTVKDLTVIYRIGTSYDSARHSDLFAYEKIFHKNDYTDNVYYCLLSKTALKEFKKYIKSKKKDNIKLIEFKSDEYNKRIENSPIYELHRKCKYIGQEFTELSLELSKIKVYLTIWDTFSKYKKYLPFMSHLNTDETEALSIYRRIWDSSIDVPPTEDITFKRKVKESFANILKAEKMYNVDYLMNIIKKEND